MDSLKAKDNYLAKDEDFEFTKGNWNDGYLVEGEGKGYFRYIGDEKVVEIPHTIQGHEMTSYYKMFEDVEVEEVISTNKNITDMSNMFQGAKSDRLDLYRLDTSNVTNMSYMFYYTSINKLDLYNLNTKNVKNMSWMFSCSNTLKINLSNFDTSKVTNMCYMFQKTKTKEIDLSSFDTRNVTDMSSMFKNSSAENIIFNDKFNTSNVINMGCMFNDTKLIELDLSSFDISKARDLHEIFSYSNIETGYVRTQEDVDRLNESYNKPKNLKFIIKQKDK